MILLQIPNVGTVCSYVFTPEFASLNGVYRVDRITNFNNAVADGISIFDQLYTPAGLTQDQYTAEWQLYQNDIVLNLISVLDDTISLYVPVSIIATVPDPTVKLYSDLAIGIHLGYYADQNYIDEVVTKLTTFVEQFTGTSDAVTLNELQTAYMTDSQYTVIESARNTAIDALSTPYRKIEALENEIECLRNKLQFYETTMIQLNGATLAPSGG